MPIYGSCPVCGNETKDYCCTSCQAREIERLKSGGIVHLYEQLLAVVDKARGNADEESDRDLYFLNRGRDEACDEIAAAIKELK